MENKLNISHEKNRKTLFRFLFYIDLIIIISAFFTAINYKVAFIVNLCFLGLQFLMDLVEPHVQGVLNKKGFVSRVNNFTRRR